MASEKISNLAELGSATVRSMSATDRRRIFRAIDDVWDESRARYMGNNSDQYLAEDLKVPRIWVETIRRESFGEAGNNADLDELKTALDAAVKKVDGYLEDALRLASKFEESGTILKDMRKRLERVETAVLPRR